MDETQQHRAEQQILDSRLDFSWGLREWDIRTILEKFGNGDASSESELFIPDYQRDYKWSNQIASRFIESILLGFPIPYLYVASVENIDDQYQDGRLEIIDGSQRIRALNYFVHNDLALTGLKQLKDLEGFTFQDLYPGRQRKFLRESLRFMELKCDADGDFRRDLFERINSGNVSLNAMEVRRGSESGKSVFYKKVILPCVDNPIFQKLAPLSNKKNENRDREEFVLRFFAYSDSLEEYNGNVKEFVDNYLDRQSHKGMLDQPTINEYVDRFQLMLQYVDEHFPLGFRKSSTSKTTYRTYFESISLGVYFALQQGAKLGDVIDLSWIDSHEYKEIIASDAANNTAKVKARINYVTEKLSGE